MRVKTFLATYLLFLCILFSSLAVVSVYMTNSQTDMLKDKSVREYHTIASTLSKVIAVLSCRTLGLSISESVSSLVIGYARYYARYNIDLTLSDLTSSEYTEIINYEITLTKQDGRHFIHIAGVLPELYNFYRLDYTLDVTESIMEMRNIQHILLLLAVIFSVITAIALYFILSSVFKPLSVVARASMKIADGQYGERIIIKDKNELSGVASGFNRMADTVQKQIYLLEEEAAAKQQFADNFAHEIRTPLTSIYGYAELLQKAPLNESEIIESAQYIMNEAGHMNKISNSLLELATLRNYTPIKKPISISRLFEDIRRSTENVLREHGVQLICRSDDGTLQGQEDLIKSLLMNLCFNALKACSPGIGVIHLTAKENIISVSDNGIGIPKESLSKITEPFYRVDKARSREQGGAGLGLALCKQIAEAHYATMEIESSPGIGTTVKVTFTSS
jgi:signal transduction histidine kinase